MHRTIIAAAAVAALTLPAIAHHGWGSYDAANPVTIEGPIVSVKFGSPHAEMTVRQKDEVWTIILAPVSRMNSRGATAQVVAVNKNVAAYGYKSTVVKNELRAERITVDGKTYELR